MEIIIIILLVGIWYMLLTGGISVNRPILQTTGKQRKIILDSCALIDGRIVEVVRTGFIADELVIPKFILSELQLLADGGDSHKRERARYGLEVAAELQELGSPRVTITEENFQDAPATDDKLVKLAKKHHGVLCTTDFNLNKVAAVEGVKTLNVNELSQSLRPVTLPGEELRVKIVQQGNSKDQGVGYLEDGTMIVVDGAARAVGSVLAVSVDRMHQTVAGKMVFAHALQTQKSSQSNNRQTSHSAISHIPTARSKQQKPKPSQSRVATRIRKK